MNSKPTVAQSSLKPAAKCILATLTIVTATLAGATYLNFSNRCETPLLERLGHALSPVVACLERIIQLAIT